MFTLRLPSNPLQLVGFSSFVSLDHTRPPDGHVFRSIIDFGKQGLPKAHKTRYQRPGKPDHAQPVSCQDLGRGVLGRLERLREGCGKVPREHLSRYPSRGVSKAENCRSQFSGYTNHKRGMKALVLQPQEEMFCVSRRQTTLKT